MRRPSIRSITFVLLLLGVVAVVMWLRREQPLPVAVHAVAAGRVEASIANTRAGTLEACQRTRLSPIMGGRIEYLGVREGDQVRKGQVLMRLWNDDQQAQANLASAQLDSARQRVGEVCAMAENAQREAERNAQMRAQGFVSAGKEESARLEAQARAAACETARMEIHTADAKLASVRVEQRRTVLVAPFAGTVAKIVGEVGEYTTPSPPGVATPPAIDLIDTGCLYVKAPMDEVDAPRLQIGQAARITLDALPGKVFEGRVRRIAPYVAAVEKQARTVDVEVAFAKPEEARSLLVGYSADVEVVLGVAEQVLRVPSAVLRDGNRVLLLGDDGRIAERTLETGLANWEYTEVRKGLRAGDRIITSLERAGVKAGALATPEAASAPKSK